MSAQSRLRGQPVAVLLLLLGGWAAMRAAVWESPFAELKLDLSETLLASAQPEQANESGDAPARSSFAAAASRPDHWPEIAEAPGLPVPALPAFLPRIELPDPLRPQLVPFETTPVMPKRMAAAHTMTLMAGLSGVPLPPELAGLLAPAARLASAPYQPLTTFLKSPEGGRWSGDAWLLLRKDTTTAITSGRGSYGRSQAGGVIRYAFMPSNPHRPMAYARVGKGLGGANEAELAVGLSARPLPDFPVRVAAEGRVTQVGGRTSVRPAGYAVTELPPFALPLGFTAEAYAQAGYVGGDYPSAFADGQVRTERNLAEFGDARITAGGGAWGGAQKGAARLDIGPSASLQLKLGQTNSRVSMDWRFRVAGDAEPASGPALTISAGF